MSGVTKKDLRVVGFLVILLIDYTLGYVLRKRRETKKRIEEKTKRREEKKKTHTGTHAQLVFVCVVGSIVYVLKDYNEFERGTRSRRDIVRIGNEYINK